MDGATLDRKVSDLSRKSAARRPIIALLVLILALFGVLAGGTIWRDASWTPKLALDLAGGTQIILTPKPTEGGQVTADTINQAIAIIRQRVDASGVAEAEISSQGGQNIVVSLPGDPAEQEEAIRLVSQSAQMQFRPVIFMGNPQPVATGTVEPAAPADGTTPAPTETGAPQETPANRALPRTGTPAPAAPPADPAAPPADSAAPPADGSAPTEGELTQEQIDQLLGTAGAGAGGGALTKEMLGQVTAQYPSLAGTPSDPANVTQAQIDEFNALDCTNPANLTGGRDGAGDKPLVTCESSGVAKYILGPVEVQGSSIDSATAGIATNQQGMSTGQWQVSLTLDNKGRQAQRALSERLVGLGCGDTACMNNQFGIVLDGLVIMAPYSSAIITDGRSAISGSLTRDTANQLASQLRFGALPMSFDVQSTEQISATLGSEQLRNGILAGVIGMLLVVVFMMWQYRALGLVTVASLLVAAALTYVTICILSWTQGYRLSLPGVTGLIVSIGVTADSFIVYFERVRDELREGRTLASAVENGWLRARQTIIASDAINLLAAVVLYFLAVGGVRGFAFTLGLTTIMDLLIVILFTHPMVSLLAKFKFFSSGHKLSGFDLSHQKRPAAYAGRGRVRSGGERMTIVERRKAEQEAAEEADDDLTASQSGPNLSKES